MATLWLWRAAQQQHKRAEGYLMEHQQRGHPLFILKRIFTAGHDSKNGKGGGRYDRNSDKTEPPCKRTFKATLPLENTMIGTEECVPKEEFLVPVARMPERAALKKAAGVHITTLEAEARAQAEVERLSRRTTVAKLCGQLIDVTFTENVLGISLVLATEHKTKRKMIIVENIRADSPAAGILEIQDELVAIGGSFDLPNHLLIFDELSKSISRQARPLVLTFGRLHTHRPVPVEWTTCYAPIQGIHVQTTIAESSANVQ